MDQQLNNDFIRKMFPGIDEINSLPTISNYSRSSDSKLSFKSLLEYKTFPCEKPECSHYPRTTVANNQYLENELRCPGWHHVKDQRRPPIKNLQTFTGEFEYQANYFKEGRCPLSKDRYSQNFFESLYHPLYYKQFACKRDHCDQSEYCPYFHSEREKIEWEVIFEQSLKVNRQAFLSTKTRQHQNPEISSKNGSPHMTDDSDSYSQSPYRSFESTPSRGAVLEDLTQKRNFKDNTYGFNKLNKIQKTFQPFTPSSVPNYPMYPLMYNFKAY